MRNAKQEASLWNNLRTWWDGDWGNACSRLKHLLEEITIQGLKWLCDELRIDWRRVLLSLESDIV